MNNIEAGSKKRIVVIFIFFILLLFALFWRMFYLQVVKAEELSQKAYNQQTKNSIISPKRGTIYDKNGVVLAKSVSVETISVTPKNVKNKEKTAEGLSEILGMDYDSILGKVNKTSVEEVIAKKLDKEITDKVREWVKEEKISGINIYEDTKRYYPKGNFLSQVIGFCGTDNQGLEGLEAKYESLLKGVPGRRITSKDATGKDMPIDDVTYIPSEDGTNIYLTIDERIQYIVEKYLSQAMEDNKPVDYGTCIVMNPQNGDILAMATAPDYDPNDPFTITNANDILKWDKYTSAQKTTALQNMWKNKCVADTYEPGSVFKVITSAIAIEEGIITNVDSKDFKCTGSLKVDEWDISCWRTTPHGVQSLRQGLMNSCNPVYMTVALRIGAQKFYSYLSAFGISKSTGSGIIGETSGIIHTLKTASKSSLATAGFGQGFTLTPLNMLNAVCSIANGGKILTPRLVKRIEDGNGNVIENYDTNVVKQVISKETSEKVLELMESVVSDGTGRYAQVKGYNIAGKTSTAEQGRGDSKTYVASFVALAPAENPQVAILFNLYNPRGVNGHQGGGIVAPVVGKVLADILEYLDIPKDYSVKEEENKIVVPNITNKKFDDAKKIITNSGLRYVVENGATDDLVVTATVPKAGESLPEKGVVKIQLEGLTSKKVEVPNVRKQSKENVKDIISKKNLNVKLSGNGVAIFQDPPAGTMVEEGTIISVEFGSNGIDVQ